MNGNRSIKSAPSFIVSLCLVSLFAAVILMIASSVLYFQNVKLKNYNIGLEKSLKALDENLKNCQETSKTQDEHQKDALDYLKWRFILKEQVEQASHRFADKAISAKKDKDLTNLIYYNLGIAHTLASDFESAIDDFQEALKNDPKDSYSYYNLALLFSTYKQSPEKALDYYKKYQSIAPQGLYRAEVRDRIRQLEGLDTNKSQK